ncbi:MAG: 2-C-methyl-D-erythritol 4-phosphate cytidylyltransferase [Prevotellaceae bacterium]|nr:2-C-methyl-D-erythritol 4-phosphate cytidylyltransferase [Prevotellaceae bacterium]
MKYGAIVLAAGNSTRYGEKKQDLEFHGKQLWRYSYETAMRVVGKENIVVVGKDFSGGSTRTGSVIKGLKALPNDIDRVIILDAARPMVTEAQVRELLENSASSVTFVRPLVNTPIFRNGTYVNRSEMYDMLVPQAFDFKKLMEAYDSGKFIDMTDETRVMFEYYGIKPTFIEAENNLYKVTYPEDLYVIESIYQKQIKSINE